MSKYNYWTTKEKQVVKITNMSSGHIQNCLTLLSEKKKWLEQEFDKENARFSTLCSSHADITDQIPFFFDSIEDWCPTYRKICEYIKVFELELKSRDV